jgi:hypothetical protein
MSDLLGSENCREPIRRYLDRYDEAMKDFLHEVDTGPGLVYRRACDDAFATMSREKANIGNPAHTSMSYRDAEDKYYATMQAAYAVYAKAREPLSRKRDARRIEARRVLLEEDLPHDKVVHWILKYIHNDGHSLLAYQANVILGELPAPFTRLDKVAAQRRWCGQWRQVVKAAVDAGVLPKETQPDLTRFNHWDS